MAFLDFHASRKQLNQLLSREIDMPNMNSILDEQVQVFVHEVGKKEFEKILSDPDEPLNIRFRMDQTNEKIPIYVNDNCKKPLDNPVRRFQFSDQNTSHKINGIITDFLPINDEILNGRFEHTFIKKSEGNWEQIFTYQENESSKKFLLPTSNAIVINDNYLFNKINQFKVNVGVSNLEKLLLTIMPEECPIEFQIAIFTSDVKWDLVSAKKHMDYLIESLKKKFTYPIFIELIIWDSGENHKRTLISNYYIATTDKGFDLFDENDKATDTNDILIRRLFHDVRQPGETPYLQSIKRLSLLKTTYSNTRNFCSNIQPCVGKIYLSSEPHSFKTNRLLI